MKQFLRVEFTDQHVEVWHQCGDIAGLVTTVDYPPSRPEAETKELEQLRRERDHARLVINTHLAWLQERLMALHSVKPGGLSEGRKRAYEDAYEHLVSASTTTTQEAT